MQVLLTSEDSLYFVSMLQYFRSNFNSAAPECSILHLGQCVCSWLQASDWVVYFNLNSIDAFLVLLCLIVESSTMALISSVILEGFCLHKALTFPAKFNGIELKVSSSSQLSVLVVYSLKIKHLTLSFQK